MESTGKQMISKNGITIVIDPNKHSYPVDNTTCELLLRLFSQARTDYGKISGEYLFHLNKQQKGTPETQGITLAPAGDNDFKERKLTLYVQPADNGSRRTLGFSVPRHNDPDKLYQALHKAAARMKGPTMPEKKRHSYIGALPKLYELTRGESFFLKLITEEQALDMGFPGKNQLSAWVNNLAKNEEWLTVKNDVPGKRNREYVWQKNTGGCYSAHAA